MNFLNSFITHILFTYNTCAILVSIQGVVVVIMKNIICVCILHLYNKVHIIQTLVHNKDMYILTTSTLITYMHSMGLIGYNVSSLNGDVKY